MPEQLDHDFYEKVVAYHMLTDEVYLASIIDHIQPKFFSDNNLEFVSKLITDFYGVRGTIPTLTELKAHLSTDDDRRRFREAVTLFEAFDPKFNKDELYDNTERFIKEKAVYHTLLDVVENKESYSDTSGILTKFEGACNITLDIDTGFDYLNNIDKHIEDLTTVDVTIPSKWSWLDDKIGGGFLENGRAIYVFAGETNIGKSIFLSNIATNIASQNKTVLVITLEMPELLYAKRFSSNITKIPISELQDQTGNLRELLQQYKDEHQTSRVLIKEFPPNTITCGHIKGFIEKFTRQGIKLDAIVIDYVNLIKSNDGNNSYERVKHATEQLRALSYSFNCPIITATQLNRQGYNESNPGLDTVSESIGLAATADCIFGIWQEDEDRELGIIRLGLMKNRFGVNFGSCDMRIDYSTLSIEELAESAPAVRNVPNNDLNDALNNLDFLSNE
jgi:replicative DNA helicase